MEYRQFNEITYVGSWFRILKTKSYLLFKERMPPQKNGFPIAVLFIPPNQPLKFGFGE